MATSLQHLYGPGGCIQREDNRGCCSIHDNDVTLERNIGLVAAEAAMNYINPLHDDFFWNHHSHIYILYINISANLFLHHWYFKSFRVKHKDQFMLQSLLLLMHWGRKYQGIISNVIDLLLTEYSRLCIWWVKMKYVNDIPSLAISCALTIHQNGNTCRIECVLLPQFSPTRYYVI